MAPIGALSMDAAPVLRQAYRAAYRGAAAARPPLPGLPGLPAAGRGRGSINDSDGLGRGRRSFLGTLTGGRQLSAGPLGSASMSDDWQSYLCQMGDHQASIAYDHGIRTSLESLPSQLVKFRVPLSEPNPHGFP